MTGYIGTPQYMAPGRVGGRLIDVSYVSLSLAETMVGDRVRYSSNVDVYSFGVLLAELISWSLA